MSKISAPFSSAQIQTLNERQCHIDGDLPLHPFTCPNRSDGVSYDGNGRADYSNATHQHINGELGLLIATEAGWVCPDCGYTQDWAYAAMVQEPVPIAKRFEAFSAAAKMPNPVTPDAISQLIHEYENLADQGKPGVQVMLTCLKRRLDALSGNSFLATIIPPDGEIDQLPLPADDEARIQQLQGLVGGYIEGVALPGGRYMVINENGKDGPHMINHTATAIAHEAEAIMPSDYIAGVAVILPAEVLQ